MKLTYIVDIDGTLAKIDHRLHFIKNEPKNWDGFFDACLDDEPFDDVIRVIQELGWHPICPPHIVYLTGRPDRVRAKTLAWLDKHNLPKGPLLMRTNGDHRPDTIAKKELLDDLIEREFKVVGVFEDRPSVCRVWREMGLTVFQVNDKEF